MIQLSPINAQYINNQKENIATKQTPLIKKDKNDALLKNHKKIVFGSIVGGVALATGACILAFKGKLGSKAQEFFNGVVNKISNNTKAEKLAQVPSIEASEGLIFDGKFDISLLHSNSKAISKKYTDINGKVHEIELIIDDVPPPVSLVINDPRVGDSQDIESQILRIKQYATCDIKEEITKKYGKNFFKFYSCNLDEIQSDILKRQYSLLKECPSNIDKHLLYRGIHLYTENPATNEAKFSELLLNAHKGDIIIPDWGITHTTPSAEWALDYAMEKNINSSLSDVLQQQTTRPALLRIHTPIGARFYARHENEIILPCMTQYKFLSKNNIGNLTIFDLEYIMPNLQ